MSDIVTLEETKAFLRVDHDDEDGIIGTMIASATEAVTTMADLWDGLAPAPARLRLAVLSRVAVTYDQRDSIAAGEGERHLIGPLRGLRL